MASLGVTLGDSQIDGRYKTKLGSGQVAGVQALPFIEKVEWNSPPAPQAQAVRQSITPGGESFGIEEPLMFDIRLHESADVPKIEAWLRAKSVAIIGKGTRKIRISTSADAPVLDELAGLPEVDGAPRQYETPILWNEFARRLLAVDAPLGTMPRLVVKQDGSGQIIGVADTGIDDTHPDFQGRIVGKVAHGRTNDTSDPDGHGTHVAGSVLGDGTASNGKIQGIAPKATLFFQSLLDGNGLLTGIPVNLNDLFEEAYKAGVRVHNNSWGTKVPSVYTMDSEEVDEFANNRKDMLIVIAAGNSGSSFQPKKSDAGFVDWLSICSPASSKNAITVGASRSDRPDGPMAQITWAGGFPNAFPSPPISNETISGDPNCMAAFSSRGPTNDHRIKPDVVAPGTDILSTRSALAQPSHYWGLHPVLGLPKDPHYAYDGGTSMAAPLVAGCAALIRQYYVQDAAHPEPSAALLKATLVNSTQWLTGADSTAKTVGKPNYHQGHGRVCMALSIPNASQPGMELRFVDEWKTFGFTRTGQRKRYRFVLPATAPELRICLAYTDAPARSLQNNVNVILQHVESSTKFLGNAELPDALTLPDVDNNLETIRIVNAQPGTYFIQVLASNLLKPPQDFALVVTGVGVPPLAEL